MLILFQLLRLCLKTCLQRNKNQHQLEVPSLREKCQRGREGMRLKAEEDRGRGRNKALSGVPFALQIPMLCRYTAEHWSLWLSGFTACLRPQTKKIQTKTQGPAAACGGMDTFSALQEDDCLCGEFLPQPRVSLGCYFMWP